MKKFAVNFNAPAWFILGTMLTPIAQAQDALIVEGTSVGVGVQNSAPQATLHVRESDDAKANRTLVRISGSDFPPQFEYENESTGNVWRLGVNPANHFVINETADLAVAELRVTPDGGLFVNGTSVHPDYVFASDYELMPLDELEEYIQENQHLPNVLNTAEREAQGGIDLASFPVQLLEKIEELTLYTIEQNRQVQSLSMKNQQLAERLDALESEVP